MRATLLCFRLWNTIRFNVLKTPERSTLSPTVIVICDFSTSFETFDHKTLACTFYAGNIRIYFTCGRPGGTPGCDSWTFNYTVISSFPNARMHAHRRVATLTFHLKWYKRRMHFLAVANAPWMNGQYRPKRRIRHLRRGFTQKDLHFKLKSIDRCNKFSRDKWQSGHRGSIFRTWDSNEHVT